MFRKFGNVAIPSESDPGTPTEHGLIRQTLALRSNLLSIILPVEISPEKPLKMELAHKRG